MPARSIGKESQRARAAKKRHARVIEARLKEIAAGKRKRVQGGGYSRKDLEALRDGRA